VTALALVIPAVSLAQAMTAPGNLSPTEKGVEWLRDHGFGGGVNRVEHWWFTNHQPKTGGTPDRGIGIETPSTVGATPSDGGSRDHTSKPADVPVRQEGDATVRVLVGEGSPIELGTPGLILDVELPRGGSFSSPISADFNGFIYMLEGEALVGSNRQAARPPQIAVLGPGELVTVSDAQPGTRFMLMAGKPYGEEPIYNGPYVD